jgi:hypothetical protein
MNATNPISREIPTSSPVSSRLFFLRLILLFAYNIQPHFYRCCVFSERAFFVSFHFMIAEMFSSLDVTRACHSRFHLIAFPVPTFSKSVLLLRALAAFFYQ